MRRAAQATREKPGDHRTQHIGHQIAHLGRSPYPRLHPLEQSAVGDHPEEVREGRHSPRPGDRQTEDQEESEMDRLVEIGLDPRLEPVRGFQPARRGEKEDCDQESPGDGGK